MSGGLETFDESMVPHPFDWNKNFQVMYENLDAEHKQLFEGVFQVEDKGAGKLDNLIDVTVEHFRDEEGMMQKSKQYHGYAAHKTKHDQFVGELKKLKQRGTVTAQDILWAKKWLCGHILTEDFQYKTKL